LDLENIIAALNTGSGKTLISILLIKWIASQENAKGKAIVFLVPRVTLVDQQAETISKRTPLRVAKLFGAMDTDINNRAGWKKKIDNQDVFVMTRRYPSTPP
jgi:endoribonuclease Dicer